MNDFSIEIYSSDNKSAWNEFIESSKNGTFLFNRDFMDYHSDRFSDFSLIIRNNKNHIVALLPGNVSNKTYWTHQGLTYGGLIVNNDMTAETNLKIFSEIKYFLAEKGIEELIYKAIPHIYHKQPSEEDLYSLFRNNAEIYIRQISTTLNLRNPLPLALKRKQKLRKSEKFGLTFSEENDMKSFIQMVDENLMNRYGVHCIHTPEEMQRLKDRFPDKIKLYIIRKDGLMICGVLCFLTTHVVHTQYMCANSEGRKYSALDFAINKLIEIYRETHEWFDFGTSNENGGRYLNENLISQKEGFGGRGIIYDQYRIKINKKLNVSFVNFSEVFQKKSQIWLQDEELIPLINAPKFELKKQRDWVDFFTKNPEKCFVKGILINNEPSGGCGIKNILIDNNGHKIGEYWGYIGDKDKRGQGVGNIIMDYIINIAKENKINKLMLKVMEFNFPARNLYKKFGFKEISLGREIIMEKIID